MITEKKLKQLAAIEGKTCISLYIPTNRYGKEVLSGKDQIQFKNVLSRAEQKLVEREGMTEAEAKEFLAPACELLEDRGFWRNQSDGLAVFLNEDRFETFTVPLEFQPDAKLSDRFYLTPLMPLFNRDGKFYLLAVSPKRVRFFEGTRYSITPMVIEDLVPMQLDDMYPWGHDTNEGLQHHSLDGSGGMFHGHGDEIKSKRQALLHRYFKDIDRGVTSLMDCDTAPLVVACDSQHFPVYQAASTCHGLWDEHISGNPDEVDVLTLHAEAVVMLSDYFREGLDKAKERYQELQASGLSSTDLQQILLEAMNGRIDTLFLPKGESFSGRYVPETGKVLLKSETGKNGEYIGNMAGIHTLLNSGEVYLVDPEQMPQDEAKISAIFRY